MACSSSVVSSLLGRTKRHLARGPRGIEPASRRRRCRRLLRAEQGSAVRRPYEAVASSSSAAWVCSRERAVVAPRNTRGALRRAPGTRSQASQPAGADLGVLQVISPRSGHPGCRADRESSFADYAPSTRAARVTTPAIPQARSTSARVLPAKFQSSRPGSRASSSLQAGGSRRRSPAGVDRRTEARDRGSGP